MPLEQTCCCCCAKDGDSCLRVWRHPARRGDCQRHQSIQGNIQKFAVRGQTVFCDVYFVAFSCCTPADSFTTGIIHLNMCMIRRFVIASMPVVLNANERRSYLITHLTTAQHHSLLVALFAQYRCIWFPLHLATRQLVLTMEYKASRTRSCGWGSPTCVLTAGIAYQYPFSTALSFLGTNSKLLAISIG